MNTKKTLLSFLFLALYGFVTLAQTAPPVNLTAVAGNYPNSVKLTWEYGSVTGTFVKFEVWKKDAALSDTSKLFRKIYTTTRKDFINGFLQSNVTYSYYVKAVVGNVASEPSNMVEYTYTPPVIAYGKISGLVVKDADNTPLVRARVQIFPVVAPTPGPGHQNNFATVMTDSNGFFTARVRTGTYYIYTGAFTYVGEYYDNAATRDLATQVVVADGDSLTFDIGLASVVPPVTHTVTGLVTDADGVTPLIASITAFKTNRVPGPHDHFGSYRTQTDSLGNFTLTIRENDTVVVYACPRNTTYKPEYFDSKATFDLADRIAVTADVANVNFTLDLKPVYANGISGIVLDSAGTTPLKGYVYVYQKQENGFYRGRKWAATDSVTGAYSFANLVPGQYLVLAFARDYKATYFRYDGEPTRDWRTADSVVVDEATVVTGINFNLRPWIRPTGGNSAVFGTVGQTAGGVVEGVLTYLQDANGTVVAASVSDPSGAYSFENLAAGSYSVVTNTLSFENSVVEGIDVSGDLNTSEVDVELSPNGVTSVKGSTIAPAEFSLSQNYPNPFNPSTVIKFAVPATANVTLSVYNVIGQKVATLVNEVKTAGSYEVSFNASALPSGLYIYKLETPNNTMTRKMMLLK